MSKKGGTGIFGAGGSHPYTLGALLGARGTLLGSLEASWARFGPILKKTFKNSKNWY